MHAKEVTFASSDGCMRDLRAVLLTPICVDLILTVQIFHFGYHDPILAARNTPNKEESSGPPNSTR